MTTPESSFDYDMVKRSKALVKRDEVLGGLDPPNYVTERLQANAADGAKFRSDLATRDSFRGTAVVPCSFTATVLMGRAWVPSFQSERLSLLDLVFAYAIAHIRGGQELGRDWYESGKLLKKKNTFTDLIACAEH